MKNKKTIQLFLLLSLVSAITYLFPSVRDTPFVLTKAFSILFLIASVIFSRDEIYEPYQKYILTGLIFSVAGDIFLVLPKNIYFVSGLTSFLVGLVFYAIGFSSIAQKKSGLIVSWLVLYGSLLLSLLIPALLAAHKVNLIAPVCLYASALVMMTYFGLMTQNRWVQVGALLFLISDSSLSIATFKTPFFASAQVIWITYYLAQLFFVRCLIVTI